MRAFRELERIEALPRVAPDFVRLETLATVNARGKSFPVYGLILGDAPAERPAFGLFAGVHGIEHVGVSVALTFLESFVSRIPWDKETRRSLSRARLVAMPLINPAGVYFRHRHNPNGVDLMRNAPVDAARALPLVGGHRLSPRLPWYRGYGYLETEAAALVEFCKRELFASRAALCLDIHSGFGLKDRLWYPYSKTRATFPGIRHVAAFANLLERTYPHHVYRVECQSDIYSTHGDLWDYLYDLHRARTGAENRLFLPWTLEIGSWIWVRKNPRQLFRAEGAFNPMKPHRHNRTMRRHLGLLELFYRAARNHRRWAREASLAHRRPRGVRRHGDAEGGARGPRGHALL